jgi:sec-independent protein translocase protein TatA
MGSLSFWHWAIVLVIILIIFGAGKLPKVMGDFAKGIKAFKSGMKEEQDQVTDAGAPKPAEAAPSAKQPAEAEKKV